MRTARRHVMLFLITGATLVAATSRADEVRPSPEAVHGPALGFVFGGPALGPASSNLWYNPALLTAVTAPQLFFSSDLSRKSAAAFGLGLASASNLQSSWAASWQEGSNISRQPLRNLRLGYARRFGPGFSAAASTQFIELRQGAGRTYGADIALAWRAAWMADALRHPWQRLQASAVVRNAIEPQSSVAIRKDSRQLAVGTAWLLNAGATVFPTLGATWQAGRPVVLSWGAMAGWRSHVLGFVWEDDAARISAGFERPSWAVSYDLETGPDVHHRLSLSWAWSEPLAHKRARMAAKRERTLQAKIDLALEEEAESRREAMLQQAAQWMQDRSYEDARSFYFALWSADHSDSTARDGLKRVRRAELTAEGEAHHRSGNYEDACTAFEAALALAPGDSALASQLQESKLAMKQSSHSRNESSRIFRAGIDQYAQKNYFESARSFRAVLAFDPDHVAAQSYLRSSERAHEQEVQRLLEMGRQKLKAQDFEGARKVSKRVLELESGQSDAVVLLRRIAREEAEARRAELERQRIEAQRLAALAKAAEEDAAPAVPPEELARTYEAAMQHYRSGNVRDAIRSWEEVSRWSPHYENVDKFLLRAYRVAGLESYTEGHLAEAVSLWEKALKLDPGNPQLRRYLAHAHAKLRRKQAPSGRP